jgi:hypothetical protein
MLKQEAGDMAGKKETGKSIRAKKTAHEKVIFE